MSDSGSIDELWGKDVTDEPALTINDTFARRYDREGQRREAQRLAEMTVANPLGSAAINVLLRCARRAAKAVTAKLARMMRRGSAPSATLAAQIAALATLPPAAVASEALARASFVCTADARELLAPSSTADPTITEAIGRVVGHSLVQKQLVALANGAKRQLVQESHATDRKEGGTLTSPAIAPAVQPQLQKRRRPAIPEATAAGDLVCSMEPPGVVREMHSVAVGAGALAHVDQRSTAGVPAPSRGHVHGRGAGRGRGLTAAGEPAFGDLHPSWQAKRRATRRATKAVSRSLRAASSHEGEVVLLNATGSS
jgi:hypothetical protein